MVDVPCSPDKLVLAHDAVKRSRTNRTQRQRQIGQAMNLYVYISALVEKANRGIPKCEIAPKTP